MFRTGRNLIRPRFRRRPGVQSSASRRIPEHMSKWIRPFGLLRAELFEEDEDGEHPPLWDIDEVLLVILLVVDVLTLPLAVLLLLGVGHDEDDGAN